MTGETSLETVRKEIDAVDIALQELIVRRTELVEQVRRIKAGWQVKIQPSREAEIVYRLLARHRGPFPKRELVAIWRNLITATLSFEGPFAVAVLAGAATGIWDAARDHFGIYTPIVGEATAAAVIEAVHRQEATVGVLPLPRAGDTDPWWRHLIGDQPGTPRVIARLPFAGPTNARDGSAEALVICPVAVAPTGRDRILLAAAGGDGLSGEAFGRALREEGLAPIVVMGWREPGAVRLCAEVEGFVGMADPRLDGVRRRLAAALDRLVWLGGYALPLTAADLAPAAESAPPSVRARAHGGTPA